MKNLLKICFIAFLAVSFTACSDDDDNNGNDDNSIADFVASNSDYSSLRAALDVAGLTETLDGDTELTVFAPNNAAFSAFLSANGFATLADVPVDVLRQTLLNHVVAGTNNASDLSTGYINSLATYGETEDNLSLYVNLGTNVVLNGQSTVTTADIDVDNGVIHAVNTVIALPTVVTFATADNTFETLVAALTRSDQPDFVSVLSSTTTPAPFTVLAPTNQAFADLLTELGATQLSDIDGPTLTAALNTHVIAGANVREEGLPSGTVSTLGADIVIDPSNATITDVNGRVSAIVVTNVQASNGVVHVIDTVLLPQL